MSLCSNTPWQVKRISASNCAMWHCLFLCHYAVHVAVFCDSMEKCVVKCSVYWDVTLRMLVESCQHLWGKFCCTITILILVWEQLASPKSSLLSTRLHSAISYKTEFLIDTSSRVLNIYLYIGTVVAEWLRHCATNWKVAGSNSDGVTGIFHWHNPSNRTMALGLTEPLTEMSTRRISWG